MKENYRNHSLIGFQNGKLKPNLLQKLRLGSFALLFLFTFLSVRDYPPDRFVVPAGWAFAVAVVLHIIEDTHTHGLKNIILLTLAPTGIILAGIILGLITQ
ncbi:hypothetical protein [Maridesulfovibrio sp.]|uniref:hypothetical protein n=1 Tax=Maridesulfovibrio sp. TaxID=2795000 RepID=UPI002A18C4AA|nr:hypothetical protein [Maridesulfovibrio sp.]